MLALSNGDLGAIAFVAVMVGSIFYMIGRVIWRLKNDDVEVAHRWSDHVLPDRTRDETPEDYAGGPTRQRKRRRFLRR